MKFNIIFLIALILGANDFITEIEYGKMLYKNPRGIGCNKCHGEKGEGMVIAKFQDYNKSSKTYYDANLTGPAINTLSLQDFTNAIIEPKDIMPTYFLTKDEIITLYKYLKDINKEKDEKKKDKK